LGVQVKIFGHYVSQLFVLLAVLDAALFAGLLNVLGLSRRCDTCYFANLVHLEPYQAVLLTGVFMAMTVSVGLYNADSFQNLGTFFKRFILGWQLIFIPSVALMAVTKATAGLPFGWYIGVLSLVTAVFMMGMLALRLVTVWWFGQGFTKKRVMVLGDGPSAESVINYIKSSAGSHLRYIETPRRPASNVTSIASVTSVNGNLAIKPAAELALTLSEAAKAANASEIVVAMEDKRGMPASALLECKLDGVNVIEGMTFWERETGRIDLSNAGAGWLAFSEGFTQDPPRRALKRALDFFISLSFLILIMPTLLVVIAAIRIESRGPIFYRQERVGLDGKVFKVWKLRSMRVDAEGDGVPQWAKTADNRVTRVGRIIRKTRLDEVPQIINVLTGDMSFIGPRPERPFFVEQLREQIPFYDLRHRVRPGITGWAQINYPYGASVEDSRMKFSYDLYYLKKNDVFMDFAILMQTVRVILFADGAR
jgi:sugar transferase (PEP-CTERM system associated)